MRERALLNLLKKSCILQLRLPVRTHINRGEARQSKGRKTENGIDVFLQLFAFIFATHDAFNATTTAT